MHRKTVLPSQERMEPEPGGKAEKSGSGAGTAGTASKKLQQPETQMDPEIMATRTATVRLTEVSRRQGQRAVHLPQTYKRQQDDLPVSGTVLMNYSMDKTVYFATLDQYKYNPALVISGAEGDQVLCGAPGIIKSIDVTAQTGTTVTVRPWKWLRSPLRTVKESVQ